MQCQSSYPLARKILTGIIDLIDMNEIYKMTGREIEVTESQDMLELVDEYRTNLLELFQIKTMN